MKNLTELLVDLKQRFGLSSVQRLVHSALLEMERVRTVAAAAAAVS